MKLLPFCTEKLTKADREVENYCKKSNSLKNKGYFCNSMHKKIN